MSEQLNPVVQKISTGNCRSNQLEQVLSQYCYLPARIADFLRLSIHQSNGWSDIGKELERNLAEEMGSRTDGLAHYFILQSCLKQEIGLEVSTSSLLPVTAFFLENIETSLANSASSYAIGIIYGLENSAVPELRIMANLINAYASLNEVGDKLIDVGNQQISKPYPGCYTLDSFFRLHLFDFEIGHKLGLVSAIARHSAQGKRGNQPIDLLLFEQGFEYCLNEMAKWWIGLAQLCSH
jgi:hypothetical protein